MTNMLRFIRFIIFQRNFWQQLFSSEIISSHCVPDNSHSLGRIFVKIIFFLRVFSLSFGPIWCRRSAKWRLTFHFLWHNGISVWKQRTFYRKRKINWKGNILLRQKPLHYWLLFLTSIPKLCTTKFSVLMYRSSVLMYQSSVLMYRSSVLMCRSSVLIYRSSLLISTLYQCARSLLSHWTKNSTELYNIQ